MITLPSGRVLPQKFSTIHQIPIVDIKVKLAELILNILDVISEQHAVAPDIKTKSLVDNFFTYLNKSCSDPHLLVPRARWLLNYGECTYDRLLLAQQKFVKHDNQIIPENNHFLIRIESLAEAIGDYRVVKEGTQQIDADVIDLLDDLSTAAIRIVPDEADIHYLGLVTQIEVLTSTVKHLMQCQDKGSDEQEHMLIVRLLEIRYTMNRHILHYKK